MLNAVIYNKAKTEVVLFPQLHQQRFNKQLREAKFQVGNRKILINNKATQWVEVLLDSHLNLCLILMQRYRWLKLLGFKLKV